MIDNLPAKTGRSLDEWFTVLDAAGLEKHGQAMALLKGEHGVSHGFANLVALQHRARAAGPVTADDLADAPPTDRLKLAGGMCTHRVDVTSIDEVDDELLGWLREAYAIA